MGDRLVTTQELAHILDVSVATVNYYTNLGLFDIRNRKGNKRLYDKEEIQKMYEAIRRMRDEGYPLRVIQRKMEKGYLI